MNSYDINIVSPCLFPLGYTSSACSNLAQEFSVPSTVICRLEAWTLSLDHVYREVFFRLGSILGPGFITMKPKISRFVTNKGSRQGKLRSQNLDEACLKRRYSVYLFKTTTQGSVVKVFDKTCGDICQSNELTKKEKNVTV